MRSLQTEMLGKSCSRCLSPTEMILIFKDQLEFISSKTLHGFMSSPASDESEFTTTRGHCVHQDQMTLSSPGLDDAEVARSSWYSFHKYQTTLSQ